jgi:two-component system response regulator RegA
MSIKIGPADCLAKSADVDMIDAALNAPETPRLPAPPDQLTSVNRANWEYINRIYEQSDRNVSQTARRLMMYRRTLQRRLRKRAPPG